MGYGYLKRKHLTLSKIFVICISINKKVIVVFFCRNFKGTGYIRDGRDRNNRDTLAMTSKMGYPVQAKK